VFDFLPILAEIPPMKRILVLSCLALAAALAGSETSQAQGPGSYSFLPFGFYQPYGAYYGTSIRTPPYFTTNPPVYYGARYARPYGLSPFASPPLLQAGDDYRGRLREQFQQPQIPTPGPSFESPSCNPCVSHSLSTAKPSTMGLVQSNPFVQPVELVAKK
jgi:hypothetical protein